jgi:hypothetical protein
MGAMTVWLDDKDDAIPDLLAADFDGRLNVIHHALHSLAADHRHRDTLRSLLAGWDIGDGPADHQHL